MEITLEREREKKSCNFLLDLETEKSSRHEKWPVSLPPAPLNPEGSSTEAGKWKM